MKKSILSDIDSLVNNALIGKNFLDKKSIDHIIRIKHKYINKIINQSNVDEINEEDLCQDLQIIFIRCLRKYDKTKGYKFSSLLVSSLRKKLYERKKEYLKYTKELAEDDDKLRELDEIEDRRNQQENYLSKDFEINESHRIFNGNIKLMIIDSLKRCGLTLNQIKALLAFNDRDIRAFRHYKFDVLNRLEKKDKKINFKIGE